MKDGFVKSSPRFFRLINGALVLGVVLLCALAALVPAPLQRAADPAHTPNPAKSAWFLLWIQELVSWSRLMVWPVLALLVLAFLLPWLPGQQRNHHATWFPPGQRAVSLATLLVTALVLGLTLVAWYLRGPNWALVW